MLREAGLSSLITASLRQRDPLGTLFQKSDGSRIVTVAVHFTNCEVKMTKIILVTGATGNQGECDIHRRV